MGRLPFAHLMLFIRKVQYLQNKGTFFWNFVPVTERLITVVLSFSGIIAILDLAVFTPPSIGERSIVMSGSVCVCVFVCSRSYLKKYTSDLHQTFVHVAYGLQCFDAVGWAAGRASGL